MGKKGNRKRGQSFLQLQLVKMDKAKLIELIQDLSWEYDRMSSSGQETLDKLFKLLDMEEEI